MIAFLQNRANIVSPRLLWGVGTEAVNWLWEHQKFMSNSQPAHFSEFLLVNPFFFSFRVNTPESTLYRLFFHFKGPVRYFGKCVYSPSCWELEQMTDTLLLCCQRDSDIYRAVQACYSCLLLSSTWIVVKNLKTINIKMPLYVLYYVCVKKANMHIDL